MENGVMEHYDSGGSNGSPIDVRVELIVAQVVEVDVRTVGRDFDQPTPRQVLPQRGGVIRNPGAGGRKRRKEPDLHVFLREPNSAVPMRMWVAPSSIATSKS
jgi:hypothetical protein